MKRFFDRHAKKVLAALCGAAMVLSLAAGTAVAATPSAGGEVGVGLICKSEGLARSVAERTVATQDYRAGGAVVAASSGLCVILPQLYPAVVATTQPIGAPWRDSDGDFVQLHLVSFAEAGVTYWAVAIEILRGV